jgi:hypothetical protein
VKVDIDTRTLMDVVHAGRLYHLVRRLPFRAVPRIGEHVHIRVGGPQMVARFVMRDVEWYPHADADDAAGELRVDEASG